MTLRTQFSLFRLLNRLLWPFLILILASVWAFYRKARPYFAERLGLSAGRAQGRSYSGNDMKGCSLFHLASLGESHAAKALLELLSKDHRLVLTTTTVTGRESLAAQMPDSRVSLAPLDLPDLWDPFLRSRGIRGIILFETEIWPMMLLTALSNGIPVALVNGRLSTSGFSGMMRFRRFLAPLVSMIDPICVQSEKDRERFIALGARSEKVFITGNLKWDVPESGGTDLSKGLEAWLLETEQTAFGADGPKPFRILLSSVHPGESRSILETLSRRSSWNVPVHIVIALRHLERLGELLPILERFSGVAFRTKRGTRLSRSAPIVLSVLDSYGELNSLYPIVDAAFIGGTLDPVGGHNPILAAKAGIPILSGPHIDHIRALLETLERESATIPVPGPDAFWNRIQELVSDTEYRALMGKNARSVFLSQKGALERTAEDLLPFWKKTEEGGVS